MPPSDPRKPVKIDFAIEFFVPGANDQLLDCSIKAPFSGYVERRMTAPGRRDPHRHFVQVFLGPTPRCKRVLSTLRCSELASGDLHAGTQGAEKWRQILKYPSLNFSIESTNAYRTVKFEGGWSLFSTDERETVGTRPGVLFLVITGNRTAPKPHITEIPRLWVIFSPVVTALKSVFFLTESRADGGYYDLKYVGIGWELGWKFLGLISEQSESRWLLEVPFRLSATPMSSHKNRAMSPSSVAHGG